MCGLSDESQDHKEVGLLRERNGHQVPRASHRYDVGVLELNKARPHFISWALIACSHMHSYEQAVAECYKAVVLFLEDACCCTIKASSPRPVMPPTRACQPHHLSSERARLMFTHASLQGRRTSDSKPRAAPFSQPFHPPSLRTYRPDIPFAQIACHF